MEREEVGEKKSECDNNIEKKNQDHAEQTNKNNSVEVIQKETFQETKRNREYLVYCEICEYKCKKESTLRKHVNTKHNQYQKCYECGKMFDSKESLECHKEKGHGQEEVIKDTSFVFSESMLDEYL